MMLFKAIEEEIDNLDVSSIDKNRKALLQQLIDYIQVKINTSAVINLNFICTHNSRRSHLSQVWAQTLAHYYNIDNVFSYSGGTEATALFPSAAEALKTSGFKIEKLSNEDNPVYAILYSNIKHPIIGFSKTFDSIFNPSSQFVAIMTCDSANEACPVVSGSEIRIPLTFEDPKAFDNTPLQAEKYRERSVQIATELKYVFSNLKTL